MLAYAWYRRITQKTISAEVLCTIQSLASKKQYLKVANDKYFKRKLEKLHQELKAESTPGLSEPENGIEMWRTLGEEPKNEHHHP